MNFLNVSVARATTLVVYSQWTPRSRRAEIRLNRDDVDETAVACLQVRPKRISKPQIANQMNVQNVLEKLGKVERAPIG
jgi:hypothetical protein